MNTYFRSSALLVLLMIASAPAWAQTSVPKAPATGTGIEAANTTRNKLVIRTTHDIGSFGKYLTVNFKAVVVSVGATKAFGVQATTVQVGEDDAAVMLDLDELRGMIEALEQIKATVSTTTVGPGEYTEAKYESRSGAEVGFYKTAGGEVKCYFAVSPRSTIFFGVVQIDQFIALLQSAITRLTTLGAK